MIESHPHREAFQVDSQQNNVCNSFSDDAKAMIREMGNVELFELYGTIPRVQCSECLLYWNQGIVNCTCGHLLRGSESSQNFHQWRLDALSIPHYVIKKGRCHGPSTRQGENYKGVHDRFLRDQVLRASQLKIGWTEQKSTEMDELAQQDHTYHLSTEEFKRYQGQWYLTFE